MDTKTAVEFTENLLQENNIDIPVILNPRLKASLARARFKSSIFEQGKPFSIEFNKAFIEVNDESYVLEVILHEVGHILVGWGHDHDEVWADAVRSLGGTPFEFANSDDYVRPQSKYTMKCDNCGKESQSHKISRRERACATCCDIYNGGRYSDEFVLRQIKNY